MKALNVGALNNRITFVNVGETKDEYGGTHQQYIDYKIVWATVKPLRGGEYYEAQKIRPEVTYKITCRYVAGITPDMRIKFKNKVFEIITVINIEELDRALEIQAVEYIEEGD